MANKSKSKLFNFNVTPHINFPIAIFITFTLCLDNIFGRKGRGKGGR